MSAPPPTADQIALTQHILEVVSRLPGTLEAIGWGDGSVTFTLSRDQYARQCHVGTLRASITLTYAELLLRTNPQWEGDLDTDWDLYAVDRLMMARWDEACEAQRRAKQAKPLSP